MTERKQSAPRRPRVASSGKRGPAAGGPTRVAGVSRAALRERAARVHERFALALPAPACELDFGNAWQLLVATILSAQSTDKMVNRVTPALFARYPSPAALAVAPQEEVEQLVRQTGFFRNKARAIREASRLLVERFGGQVPRTLEELTQLPGVARKTANVVLGTAYRISSGIIVDTHAGRVARRLGLTRAEGVRRGGAGPLRPLPGGRLDRYRPSAGAARPLRLPGS